MAYWIGKLTDLTDLPEGFTINIGTVAGGEAANIVASEANMVVDLRLVRLEQEKKFNDCIIRLKEHGSINYMTPQEFEDAANAIA